MKIEIEEIEEVRHIIEDCKEIVFKKIYEHPRNEHDVISAELISFILCAFEKEIVTSLDLSSMICQLEEKNED
jgi:dGTP triphosphohydrolase